MGKRLLLFLRFALGETELKPRVEDAAMRIRHRNRAALNVWRDKRRHPLKLTTFMELEAAIRPVSRLSTARSARQ